ncbi:MAG: hypothetical protein WC058_14965, partial [Phycisphaeraceae bacterium]
GDRARRSTGGDRRQAGDGDRASGRGVPLHALRQDGRRWNERIWTVIATLTQQGRGIFAYLRDALHAALNHQPLISLLPAGP